MVQRKRDPSGGETETRHVTIHACTRCANGGKGISWDNKNDSKDRSCCIIHRWRQRRNGTRGEVGKEERWRWNTNREKEFRGKKVLMKTVDVGQLGYKTIEKRLIPEEDHRMKSDITRREIFNST